MQLVSSLETPVLSCLPCLSRIIFLVFCVLFFCTLLPEGAKTCSYHRRRFAISKFHLIFSLAKGGVRILFPHIPKPKIVSILFMHRETPKGRRERGSDQLLRTETFLYRGGWRSHFLLPRWSGKKRRIRPPPFFPPCFRHPPFLPPPSVGGHGREEEENGRWTRKRKKRRWIRRRVNFCFFWRGGIHLYFYQAKCLFQERTAFLFSEMKHRFSQISVESLPDSSFLLSSVPYPSLPCFSPPRASEGKREEEDLKCRHDARGAAKEKRTKFWPYTPTQASNHP